MYLATLKLAHFKNYESQQLDFSERLNCLTGLNGMGKTNVLDAIHYLCLCKSNVGLPDKNLVQHGADFFRLEGQFVLNESDTDKVVAKYALGQRRIMERNGAVQQRLTDYIGQFPVVMIAPDDVVLVQEGSEERRRFLDVTMSQISPGYLHNLMVYNALLKQRNALLKTFASEKRFDAALLEAVDRQMPAPAQAIFEQRKAFVAELEPLFSDYYAAISNSREQVRTHYASDMQEASLDELFHTHLEKDRILQRTTSGPHRDDLELEMDGQTVKKFASQGQLKSVLLAMRLAQYAFLRAKKATAPLLLLDDIFDKLDENRVRQLVALLLERNFGQIFITDTQRSRMEAVVAAFSGDYRMFEVKEGRITT
ncbi:MAG: DNA replication/repair protein RecF [Bacteroidetes bacterium]|nr:DNA replication/repair protein RecF [Bacteroidota bacterium]